MHHWSKIQNPKGFLSLSVKSTWIICAYTSWEKTNLNEARTTVRYSPWLEFLPTNWHFLLKVHDLRTKNIGSKGIACFLSVTCCAVFLKMEVLWEQQINSNQKQQQKEMCPRFHLKKIINLAKQCVHFSLNGNGLPWLSVAMEAGRFCWEFLDFSSHTFFCQLINGEDIFVANHSSVSFCVRFLVVIVILAADHAEPHPNPEAKTE